MPVKTAECYSCSEYATKNSRMLQLFWICQQKQQNATVVLNMPAKTAEYCSCSEYASKTFFSYSYIRRMNSNEYNVFRNMERYRKHSLSAVQEDRHGGDKDTQWKKACVWGCASCEDIRGRKVLGEYKGTEGTNSTRINILVFIIYCV